MSSTQSSCTRCISVRTYLSLVLLLGALSLTSGCGTSSSPNQVDQNAFSGTTAVTLLATSTANDTLNQFQLQVQSLTLTTQSGTAATFSPPPGGFLDFIHINGLVEPLTNASIPQGIYTSATATIGSSNIGCIIFANNSINNSVFQDQQTPSSSVKVIMPSPITITGSSMGLLMNLIVSQSYTLDSCAPVSPDSYAITPTFNITPITFSSNAASSANGRLYNLAGTIGAAPGTGSEFSVDSMDGLAWSFNTNAATTVQGVGDLAAITLGMPVNLDASIQADGSMLATRIGILNANTVAISQTSGPLESYAASTDLLRIENPGYNPLGSYNNYTNSSFSIAGGYPNLTSLPFTPVFDASSMVLGQELTITSNTASAGGGYIPASTITLSPQSINGTITNVSTSAGFTTYSVKLADYNLFPNLSPEVLQANPVSTPNIVTVYADSSTQIVGEPTTAVGGIVRFYGLVFDDNGVLRMDCSQISAGVSE